jgi:hypothetical protein
MEYSPEGKDALTRHKHKLEVNIRTDRKKNRTRLCLLYSGQDCIKDRALVYTVMNLQFL